MTQTKENVRCATEFDTLFMKLNEKGQEAALSILRSLDFEQSVINMQRADNRHNPAKRLT